MDLSDWICNLLASPRGLDVAYFRLSLQPAGAPGPKVVARWDAWADVDGERSPVIADTLAGEITAAVERHRGASGAVVQAMRGAGSACVDTFPLRTLDDVLPSGRTAGHEEALSIAIRALVDQSDSARRAAERALAHAIDIGHTYTHFAIRAGEALGEARGERAQLEAGATVSDAVALAREFGPAWSMVHTLADKGAGPLLAAVAGWVSKNGKADPKRVEAVKDGAGALVAALRDKDQRGLLLLGLSEQLDAAACREIGQELIALADRK